MFDEEKIPVAKLREAFNLNEHDVDKLIMQLWPDHVFPWEIWEAAYKKHWKSASIDNAEYFKIPFTPFPTMKGIWDFSQADWCRTQMWGFVSALIYALPAQHIESGFEYICTEVYDHPEIAYKDERKILFDRLYEIENEFDWRIYMPIDWDRLEQILNDKAYHIGREKKDFISDMFFDTILLNKFAACTIMVKYSRNGTGAGASGGRWLRKDRKHGRQIGAVLEKIYVLFLTASYQAHSWRNWNKS